MLGRCGWMEMLKDLRKYITQYDKIVWIEDSNHRLSELVRDFCNSKAVRTYTNRLLILSIELLEVSNANVDYRMLRLEEQEMLRTYYKMYEFSDCLIHLSSNDLYGGLCNYVDTGWLSQEEVFEVILR